MADTIVITLRKPISLSGVDNSPEYSTLTLREPIARELEEAGGSNVKLISIVSAIPLRAVEQLCGRDYLEAAKAIESFLAPTPDPSIGEKSSPM